MNSAPDFNEVILARKIRRALDEGAAQLPDQTVARLAAARANALARKKAAPEPARAVAMTPALAAAGGGPLGSAGNQRGDGHLRLRLWIPLVVLAASLFGIAHWEEEQRVTALANLDAEVLSDTLPLDAYLDHGFNEYLARNR